MILYSNQINFIVIYRILFIMHILLPIVNRLFIVVVRYVNFKKSFLSAFVHAVVLGLSQ